MKLHLTIAEVAARLAIPAKTALRNVRSGAIPGGELLYVTEGGRSRWRVDRAAFEAYDRERVRNVPNGPNVPDVTTRSGTSKSE